MHFLNHGEQSHNRKIRHDRSECHHLHPDYFSPESTLLKKLNEINESIIISPEAIKQFDVTAYFLLPLYTKDKRLLGLIKIEAIDFVNVTTDNVRFLALLGK